MDDPIDGTECGEPREHVRRLGNQLRRTSNISAAPFGVQAVGLRAHSAFAELMQTVVHLVSGDKGEQETSLAIARNLLDDESGSIDDVAIVVQSEGMEAITAGGDTEEQVQALLDDGVSFKACQNTLEMMEFNESDLIEGIETVPEGAVEVTRLETDGYAYVRP